MDCPNNLYWYLLISCIAVVNMATLSHCHNNLKILQWNCQGLTISKTEELKTYINTHIEYDLLALQETLWTQIDTREIGDYHLERIGERENHTKDYQGKRGICLAIHPKHQHTVIRKVTNTYLDLITIKLERGKNTPIYVTNIYRKFTNDKKENHNIIGENLVKNITGPWQDHIICGDLNCHSSQWGSPKQDTIGEAVAEWILEHQIDILNDGNSTRVGNTGSRDTAIDLTLLENQKSLNFRGWETLPYTLPSDHHPISVFFGNTFKTEKIVNKTLKFKLHKANWEGFRKDSEIIDWKSCRDKDLQIYLRQILDKIIELAKKHIPHDLPGKLIKPKKAVKTVPWWDDEIQNSVDTRNAAFRNFKKNRNTVNQNIYKEERNKTKNLINKKRKEFFANKVKTLNEKDSVSDFWKFVKAVDGNVGCSNTIAPLHEGDNIITDPKQKAEKIAKHLQQVSSDDNLNVNFKLYKYKHEIQFHEKLKRKRVNNEVINRKFTMSEYKSSLIRKSDTSPGQDSVSYIILKQKQKQKSPFSEAIGRK